MSRVRLVVLATSALLLLGLAVFDPWASAPAPQEISLVPQDLVDSAQTLTLEQSDSTYELFLADDGYQLRSPVSAPANQEAIRQLFEAMRLLRSRRRAASEVAGDIVLRITLTGPANAFELMVGNTTADSKHHWVRTSASKGAHLVEAHLIEELQAVMDMLPSRKLVAFELSKSEALRLDDGELHIEIEGNYVSGTGLDGVMPVGPAAWALVAALQALRFESLTLEAERCLSEAVVHLAQGEHTIALQECGACSGNLVELQVDHRRGCVAVDSWGSLRAALANPAMLVDLALLPAEPEAFSLRCGDRELVVVPEEVDGSRLQEWWSELRASATRVALHRFASADVVVQRCRMEVGEQHIAFFQGGENWSAELGSTPLRVELNAKVADLLDITAQRFAPLRLIEEESIYARRIQIRRRGWREFRKLESTTLGGAWQADSALWSEEQSTGVADLLRSLLSSLRAESFSDATRQGLSKADVEITIVFEAALTSEMRSYLVEIWRSVNQCSISVDRGPVALVDPSLCTRIDAAIPR